jgi:hypothetical protein
MEGKDVVIATVATKAVEFIDRLVAVAESYAKTHTLRVQAEIDKEKAQTAAASKGLALLEALAPGLIARFGGGKLPAEPS